MKFLVIADDLTGAAEIAALGHRYGLKTRLVRGEFKERETSEDLTVLDTDTRLLGPSEAANGIKWALTSFYQKLFAFDSVYKKIDSVLRGPVLAEVEAMLDVLGLESALLIPANPSRGRTISHGVYSINQQPLNLTTFGHDPEYPCRTAHVVNLLGASPRKKLSSIAITQSDSLLNPGGIIIGDATSMDDVRDWAKRLNRKTLPVGGADFFQALLDGNGIKRVHGSPADTSCVAHPVLVVCGSASDMSRESVRRAQEEGFQVLAMPDGVYDENVVDSLALRSWVRQIQDMLRSSQHAILAIPQPVSQDTSVSSMLPLKMAEVVAHVLSSVSVGRLFLEGGATASAIVARMGWKDFSIQGEMAPGIVQLCDVQHGSPQVIMKPGSYSWPISWEALIRNDNAIISAGEESNDTKHGTFCH